jgi:hypothetical protein
MVRSAAPYLAATDIDRSLLCSSAWRGHDATSYVPQASSDLLPAADSGDRAQHLIFHNRLRAISAEPVVKLRTEPKNDYIYLRATR